MRYSPVRSEHKGLKQIEIMYYREKIINGIKYIQTSPNGEWRIAKDQTN